MVDLDPVGTDDIPELQKMIQAHFDKIFEEIKDLV